MESIHIGMFLLLAMSLCGCAFMIYSKKINHEISDALIIFTTTSLICLIIASALSMILAG